MNTRISLRTLAVATLILGTGPMITMTLSTPAVAQGNPVLTNVVPESAAATIQAKITAIDPSTREVTLTGTSGKAVTVKAGPAVRLEMLKVGDTVNAKYYRSVGFAVSPPKGGTGVPVSEDQMSQMIAQPAQAPGGVALRLTKVSGTVVALNVAEHSLDVVNPSGGGIYTINVTDPERIAMLSSLKVGDTITAVISEALAVSIEKAS